jgi:hypothetical protein
VVAQQEPDQRLFSFFSFAIFLDCTKRVFPDSGVPFTGFDCWLCFFATDASPGLALLSMKAGKEFAHLRTRFARDLVA